MHLRVFLPSPTGWYDTKRFGSSVIIIITTIIIIIAVGNYGVFFSLVVYLMDAASLVPRLFFKKSLLGVELKIFQEETEM